uniref:DUF4218 domain-containing protein n=1 Tax=Cajanus cajan TaxID=3821 RepID=A0A151RXF0_CAJCA|nr:hypothetical protein KK1_031173 [Cajanus cajan]
MIHDVSADSFNHTHVYDCLCSDAEKPLYPNYANFTQLSTMLRLFNLKEKYDARKILCLMGMKYESMLDVRHCIDVMHVEKNMCDGVIEMLLNIQGVLENEAVLTLCQLEMYFPQSFFDIIIHLIREVRFCGSVLL